MKEPLSDEHIGVPPDRFPIEPLEALARQMYPDEETRPWSDRAFGEMIGVAGRTVGRWRAAGGHIPWDAADLAAVRLGLHPMILWPERWMALRQASDAELREAWDAIDATMAAQRQTTSV